MTNEETTANRTACTAKTVLKLAFRGIRKRTPGTKAAKRSADSKELTRSIYISELSFYLYLRGNTMRHTKWLSRANSREWVATTTHLLPPGGRVTRTPGTNTAKSSA